MIATARSGCRREASQAWHHRFLEMLPGIQCYVRARLCGFALKRERTPCAKPSPMLSWPSFDSTDKDEPSERIPLCCAYAVAQFHAGRRVGNPQNSCDVFAKSAQRRNGFKVESFQQTEPQRQQWIEATLPDQKTPILDQVAFRCDFPAWLATHSRRNRRIAEMLAVGYSPGAVAKRFGLSLGRISQLRRTLRDSWHSFHGEPPPT